MVYFVAMKRKVWEDERRERERKRVVFNAEIRGNVD
jgi:hypothetical protein